MAKAPVTYSFLDVQCAIVGPGGSFSIGSGSGAAEEGITIEPSEDLDTMTIGADGQAMHSLHADKSAKVTVRLLKTSPTNSLLAAQQALQRTSGASHGQNTLTVVNTVTGDVITCQQVAYAKVVSLTYAKDAGINEWHFNVGIMDVGLGGGL